MRNEGTELEAAVKEALDIGEAAQCPVEISHLKVDAPSRWGASAKALAMIDAARAKGMRVNADVYLYDAASSTLGIRFPSWALEGGQDAINQRLDDAATWARIKEEMKKLIRERGLENYSFARIASYRSDPSLNGLSIPDAARKVVGGDDLEAQLELMRRMLRAGGASMVYQFMAEDDIGRILRHPFVSIASDSGLNVMDQGVPHPRGYGNNARALARYVRERKIVSLEEAVRKMTSLPGRSFRLPRSRPHRARPGRRHRHLRSGAHHRPGDVREAASVRRRRHRRARQRRSRGHQRRAERGAARPGATTLAKGFAIWRSGDLVIW